MKFYHRILSIIFLLISIAIHAMEEGQFSKEQTLLIQTIISKPSYGASIAAYHMVFAQEETPAITKELLIQAQAKKLIIDSLSTKYSKDPFEINDDLEGFNQTHIIQK